MMWRAFGSVIIFAIFLTATSFLDVFSQVTTELGQEYYGEVSHFKTLFPVWLKMPFNTFVNLGYIVVGAYWCAVTTVSFENGFITYVEAYLFYIFNISATFYGAVQSLRIITQRQPFAVMDQWCTLPFFMFVLVWGLYFKKGWSTFRAAVLITLSMASYILAIFHPLGFEIVLGCHFLLALYGGFISYSSNPCRSAKTNFLKAVLCLIGFVVLKVFDLQLAAYHKIFTIISGHFLSKICDILQIHYVNEFFQSILIHKWQLANKKNNEDKVKED